MFLLPDFIAFWNIAYMKLLDVTYCQAGFIDFVVAPLYQAVVTILPQAYPLKQAVEANRREQYSILDGKQLQAK
eukprot:426530-Pelagomonas_calceolata.AAC.2